MSWTAAWLCSAVLAEEPPATPPTFQPGEISIGEPIALPFGRDPADESPAAPASSRPADDPRAVGPAPAAAGLVPGSGWLGLAVAESTVPGRWRVEEVAAGGPAARAGIAVGDELRAVNGVALSSAEHASEALTTIAAGQDVQVTVARADQPTEIVLRAEPRPAPRPVEPQRLATQPAPPTAAPPSATAAPPAAPATAFVQQATTPPAQSSPPAAVPFATAAATPAPVPQARPDSPAATWQSVPRRPPVEAPASRLAAPTAAPPTAVVAAPPSAVLPAPMAAPPRGSGRAALGVRTVPIDPVMQARFQLPEPAGAYVIGVVHDLPAARAGVPPGSVIVSLGNQPVRSPLELTQLVTSGPVGRPVSVRYLLPGGEAKQAEVVLQPLDVPLERALTGGEPTPAEAPTLQPAPAPRRTERPLGDDGTIRAEIRGMRERLERLERLLEAAVRRGR